jgi:NADH:ubiquinone oxidoreductase subunit 2 (subunit N)
MACDGVPVSNADAPAVSALPFLATSFGFGILSLLTRSLTGVSFAIGSLGLLVSTLAALAIVPGDRLSVGGGFLVGSEYQRIFLAMGCSTSLLLCLLGWSASNSGSWQRNLPGASLAAFGAAGLALAIPDPITAIAATVAAGLVGVLVSLVVPITSRRVGVGARELRAIAVAGVLALIAMAWMARPLGALSAEPAVVGLAYLAMAIAVAFRFGAIPFHVWAARVADSAPEIALPLLMAWSPAVFAVVGLAWVDGSIAPLTPVPLALAVERALIVSIAAISLLLGAFAAWIQEDIEHMVAYSIVQDAAFVLLAFGPLDPATWQPVRTWILVFVLAKTAFAAWVLAIRARFGTRRLGELRGWARSSPTLTAALVIVALATVGLPGLVSFDARMTLIRLASDGPARAVLSLGAIAALAYYARLLAVGLADPAPGVRAVAGDRPRWPEGVALAGWARSSPSLDGPRTAPEASSQPGVAERRRSRREVLFPVRARSSVQAPSSIHAPSSPQAPSSVQALPTVEAPPTVQARSAVQRPSPIQSPSAATTRWAQLRPWTVRLAELLARVRAAAGRVQRGPWPVRLAELIVRGRVAAGRARQSAQRVAERGAWVAGRGASVAERGARAVGRGARMAAGVFAASPRWAGPLLDVNRTLVSSVLVLALALAALVAAAGGWGGPAAAKAPAPEPGVQGQAVSAGKFP